MRTTLDIDDDILCVARDLAAQRKTSAGKVLSELARQGLRPRKSPRVRNGVRIFEPKPGARPPTLRLINVLRDAQ